MKTVIYVAIGEEETANRVFNNSPVVFVSNDPLVKYMKPIEVDYPITSEEEARTFVFDLVKRSLRAEHKANELLQWKHSALNVIPDMQKIGELIGVPLGESVSDKIIPWIEGAKKQMEHIHVIIGHGPDDTPAEDACTCRPCIIYPEKK